ncbi:hypothetical protein QCA50_008513 [Cerrena zonata]|uniref:HCP-like protein n=1 Tax=Cerrena zonata TaxID=2478898 RepID=A0AAW0GDT2_9APHY
MEVLSQARTPSPNPGPSAYDQSSPLDALVRRASSRRVRNKDTLGPIATSSLLPVHPSTPPRHPDDKPEWSSPHSPLLHTQFRNSTATTASYLPDRGSTYGDTSMSSDGWGDRHMSNLGPMRGPVLSTASEYTLDEITGSYRDSYNPSPHPGTRQDIAPSPLHYQVPTVVVSDLDVDSEPYQQEPSPPSNRMPSRLPASHKVANFSRPVPPVINGTMDRKMQVLARNGGRPVSPLMHDEVRSLSGMQSPDVPPSPSISIHPPPVEYAYPSPSSQYTESFQQQQQSQRSPYGPPPRSASPSTSVYSNYSYYPYPGSQPTTPTGNGPHLGPSGPRPSGSQSRPTSPNAAQPNLTNPQTAMDFLQLGIQAHLANNLTESAKHFEKSATLGGGCGIGMLMWGLTLRHGWGVTKSEPQGFKWLKKAAEIAVGDLESARGGMDAKGVKDELVLAIYEVGQSFFRGWGIEKDKKMGVSYFRVAARLGDPDAQQELAFCLANGKGCKKDRKEAAKWYRAAVAQGVSDIGLAWIYKEKFQD